MKNYGLLVFSSGLYCTFHEQGLEEHPNYKITHLTSTNMFDHFNTRNIRNNLMTSRGTKYFTKIYKP